MARIDLSDVETELESHGFAIREGGLHDVVVASLMDSRWQHAPQKGGTAVSVLRPMNRKSAPSRTLSAEYGLDAQPLHTDGAHLRKMPDVVVLHSANPTPTGTAVWKLGRHYPSALKSGVFTVRGDGGSFLAHALADQRLRFDPVCMSPADQFAKEAKAYFASVREEAHVHSWIAGGTLLFIDNRRALHGREAVTQEMDADTRTLERSAYYLEKR